ncbi:hypothetical protein Pint_32863 [Pistacia integerrima]|uniref:Uncharacterized protein n=1 Tax=Pistacia integerrima TaxID=434235 RepID=A0ACC0X5X9_9ROSI|nr:hypothetical protein Pint_32863 [Pistacia integerrima]
MELFPIQSPSLKESWSVFRSRALFKIAYNTRLRLRIQSRAGLLELTPNRVVSELGMAEDSVSRLETEVGHLSSTQERAHQEMQELFAAMNAKFDVLVSQRLSEQGDN